MTFATVFNRGFVFKFPGGHIVVTFVTALRGGEFEQSLEL